MTRLLTNTLDTVLDRRVVPGYPKIGYGLRRMTWEKDDPLLTVASAAADRLLPCPPDGPCRVVTG